MRWLFLLTLSLSLLLFQPPKSGEGALSASIEKENSHAAAEWPQHLHLAMQEVGVTEEPGNRGPDVARFMSAVGLSDGFPWCAGFTSYILDASGATSPTVRSALAQDFITSDSIEARRLLRTGSSAPPGMIAVWKRGDTIFGHTDFIISNSGESVRLVGGNVREPGGSAEGVFVREAQFQPLNFFRITHLTPVSYAEA